MSVFVPGSNPFPPSPSRKNRKAFARKGAAARPFLIEPLEARQLLSTTSSVNIAGFTKNIGEDTATAFTAADFTTSFGDSTSGGALASIVITSLPKHGVLTLAATAGTTPITVGETIAAADLSEITYTPSGNYTGSDTFKWTASDGTHVAAAAASVTLNVVNAIAISGVGSGATNAVVSGSKTVSAANSTDFNYASSSTVVTRSYTITNLSDSSVTLGTGGASFVSISGKAATDFTAAVTNSDGSAFTGSLAAGASITLTITFTEHAAGTRAATVSLAGPTGALTFAISGVGVNTTTATDGLQSATVKAGKGTGAVNYDAITVNYTGYLLNGTKFDSSLNLSRSAFEFILDNVAGDSKSVIDGWEEGLQGLKIGETRVLIIPSTLAYGSTPSGSIPANSTLIFTVTGVSIAVPKVVVAGVIGPVANSDYVFIKNGDKTPSSTDNTLFGNYTGATLTETFAFGASGDGAVTYQPITITGANSTDFTASSISTTTGVALFTISFSPGGSGTRTAVVHITTNDPVTPDFTFTISATANYLDIKDSVGTAKLPAAVVAGSTTKVTLPVTITNIGSLAVGASQPSTDIVIKVLNTLTAETTTIATFTSQSLKGLGFNKSKTFNLAFTVPSTLAAGTYEFVVDVNDSGDITESNLVTNNPSINNSVTGTQILTVDAAAIDIAGTLLSSTVKTNASGATGNISVNILNNGNVPLPTGEDVSLTLYAVPVGDSDPADRILLGRSDTLSVSALAAGKSSKFTVPVTVTSKIATGQYFVEVDVSPVQSITETSTTNNLITTTASGAQLTLTA